MGEVRWTKTAKSDLLQIHHFIAENSELYAQRLVNKIVLKTENIINFPKSGRVVPELGNQSIREILEGNYRIVYRLELDQNVSVLRQKDY